MNLFTISPFRLLLVTASFLLVSVGFAPPGPPALAKETPRESGECVDCHEDSQDALRGSVHAIRLGKENPLVACSDCHAGDARHYEDPETYPRANPAKLRPVETAGVCATCHVNSHQQNMREGNPHLDNGVGCSDCHQVHGNERAGLLIDSEMALCLDCHSGVRGEFAKPFRHPVADGVVKCSECHMTLDRTQPWVSYAGSNAPCYSCHNEFQGPFPFEHQATLDFSTDEGGCLNCHEAHGSHLPRMLKQSYESPNFSLCSQCHIVPKHQLNNFHGSQWAGMPCNDCHVDIHGSYESGKFFDPGLKAQGCINVGCHKF